MAIQFPCGESSEFKGIIDLIDMKYYTFEGENGEKQVTHEIPEILKADAEERREILLDTASLFDDELAHKFLEGEDIPVELLKKAIRKGVVTSQIYPILVGSALKNAGVQLMLDAVVDFLPSPLDIGGINGVDIDDNTKHLHRDADENAPVSALAFKIMTDPYVGTLTFVRVYSGTIKSGDQLLNPVTGQKERVGRLLLMHSNKREEISEISAGHICAFL